METGKQLLEEIEDCEKLLIGLGEEWKKAAQPEIMAVYEKLNRLIGDKDFFLVTTVTDGVIFESPLDSARMVAPCGNETWRQCSEACTKDIWEPGEVPDDICPHCGAPLTGNTIQAKTYIEEGYLPQWNAYTGWLSKTLNKRLLILELGVGFQTPTVIRWPFEKTLSVNNKARMYRVHERLAQLSEGMKEKACSISENSVEFIRNL